MGRAIVLLLCCMEQALACKCLMSLNACHEAQTSGVVFAGTVESIEPSFLRDWNPAQRQGLLRLNEDFARARAEGTAAALAKLKSTYRDTFPDIPADRKQKLESARTAEDLAGLFYGILDSGKRIRFHVRTSFKQDDDDDDKPVKSAKSDESTLEVWTPFGDCGYDFEIGETYLVYADNDEETGTLSTGMCSRTRRLTDAGDDLAFLLFRKDDAAHSARLEGFVTGDEYYQANIDKLHDPLQVKSPLPGLVVELQSATGTRHVRSGADGRFVFDGLSEGAYKVTAFKPDYPRDAAALSSPRIVRVEEKACVLQMLLVK